MIVYATGYRNFFVKQKNLINKIVLFVPIISALIMETIRENLKEDPEEDQEVNMENAFCPEQSCSEEDHSDG
jgi:hypothetical protein